MERVSPQVNRHPYPQRNNKVASQKRPPSATSLRHQTPPSTDSTQAKNKERHFFVNSRNSVRDFSKIKKEVKQSPPLDKSDQVNKLKKLISNNSYPINYDKMAERMLTREF